MAEPDFDRILAVKKAAQGHLMAIPGVHAVGVGAKIVGGQRTAEPAIIVFLLKKKPLSELAPHEVISPEIDGVKTDLVEMGIPQILAAGEIDPDTEDYWSLGNITLMGGMQIQSGQSTVLGTLGCIARTTEPDPKFVAITCQHVVAVRPGRATTLMASVSEDQHTITLTGSNTPGSLVVTSLKVLPTGGGAGQDLDAFWMTTETDTLATIAKNVETAINGLSNPGVQATSQTNQVTVASQALFVITTKCEVFDPHGFDDDNPPLRSFIDGNVITLQGRLSDDYGIYANLNTDGTQPSHGVFTPVGKKDSLASVASLIAGSINGLKLAGIHATEAGSQITVNGAKEVECDITTDVRVGQPTNSFCSRCCWCCNNRIGRIIDAHLEIDTAVIQLDPGIRYKAEILEIGVINGEHAVSDSEAINSTYQVKKRGRTTRLTTGTVAAMHVDGDIGSGLLVRRDGTKGEVFHRHYIDSMWIRPDDTQKFNIEGDEVRAFSYGGDSGAALVNTINEIVGIVFGGTKQPSGDRWGLATPIQAITKALDLSIEIATAPNQVSTVPKRANLHAFAVTPDPVAEALEAMPMSRADDQDRFREMEREITATPAGAKYAELARRHFAEAQTLVNTNRRVATVWHRSGGPQLIQCLLQMIWRHDQALPVEIGGKPLSDCLVRIERVLARYGSRALSADLSKYGPPLGQLAGLTYHQVLAALQTATME